MKLFTMLFLILLNGARLLADAPPPQPAFETDNGLTVRVKSVINRDPTFAKYYIDVQTIYGVVTLLGEVDSEAVKNAIGERVKGINGVKSVNNRITISRNSMS